MQEPPPLPLPSSSPSLLEASSPAMACYRAQVLVGDYSVFETGQQPSSQQKRQLDVLPISAYSWDSDLPSGSGRLIAANYSYVCYCLRTSCSIRVLGRNVPSCGLFKGHTQKVTDMELCAKDDVNLVASVSLDGRLFVWSIVDSSGGEDDFQLQPHILLDIQFDGAQKVVCPRVCWHPQYQNVLIVSMNNHIFKVDVEKARTKASQAGISENASLSCSSANPIDGVICIGHHDSEVTDLSVFSRDILYVASACNDGMVRVWEDCKSSPLAVLMPHDGEPVGGVFFLTCSSEPDKAALLTIDMTKKKLRLWVPSLSSRYCTWYLVQTLEFKQCDGTFVEKPFSNQICTVPQAGFIFMGNSETPALFSVHLMFNSALNGVRMDFIAEFSLSMPILSFTALAETGSSCKDVAHVFCVQTQAIQEYVLNISDCLSPQCDEAMLISSSAALLEGELKKISIREDAEGEQESKRSNMTVKEMVELATGNSSSGSGFGSWVEVPNWIAATIKRSIKSVSPLASGHSAGSYISSMEDHASSSRDAADEIRAGLSPFPSSRFLPTTSGSSKIAESLVLPVEHNAFIGIGSESMKPNETAKTISDVAGKQCLYTLSKINHQESESTRNEDPCVILPGSRVEPGSETATNACSAVKSDHCEQGIRFASATVGEVKPDFLFAKEIYMELQEALAPPFLESPIINLKKKRTRRRRRGCDKANRGTDNISLSPNRASEDTAAVCASQEDARTENLQIADEFKGTGNACSLPSFDGEMLSVHLAAIKGSLDDLLTSQTELQRNISTVIEVPLSNDAAHTDASPEDWIGYDLGCHADTVWRQFVAKSNERNTSQWDWVRQLQKVLEEIFTMEFLSIPTSMLSSETVSHVGSLSTSSISASVESLLATRLPPVLEGCNKKFLEYVENSLDSILSSSIREQVDILSDGFWKLLIQVERKFGQDFVNKLR